MIKDRAKSVLRFNYRKAFVVSLVLLFAGAGRNRVGSNNGSNSNYNRPISNEVVRVYGNVVLFVASIWNAIEEGLTSCEELNIENVV